MNGVDGVTTSLAAAIQAWGDGWLNRPTMVLVVLGVTLLIDVAQRLAFGWLARRARKSTQVWDGAMAGAAKEGS